MKAKNQERHTVLKWFSIAAFLAVHLLFVVQAGLLCEAGSGVKCVITTLLTPVFSWPYWTMIASGIEDFLLNLSAIILAFCAIGVVLLLRYGSREKMGVWYTIARWFFVLVLPILFDMAILVLSGHAESFAIDYFRSKQSHWNTRMALALLFLGIYPLSNALLIRAVYELSPAWKRAQSAIWGCVFLLVNIICAYGLLSVAETDVEKLAYIGGRLMQGVGLVAGVYLVIRYGEASMEKFNDWIREFHQVADVSGNATRINRARPVVQQLLTKGIVAIPGKDYSMGNTVVTQKLWEGVMGNASARFPGADRPMENVSWKDCEAFIKDLNGHPDVKAANLKFRLPTDEEWEHACRAGSTGDWGLMRNAKEGSIDAMGWYDKNGEHQTHPVATKEPNAWGLYDMHGNVWEWTSTPQGSDFICRGGAWDSGETSCAAESRRAMPRKTRRENIGFRLVACPKR